MAHPNKSLELALGAAMRLIENEAKRQADILAAIASAQEEQRIEIVRGLLAFVAIPDVILYVQQEFHFDDVEARRMVMRVQDSILSDKRAASIMEDMHYTLHEKPVAVRRFTGTNKNTIGGINRGPSCLIPSSVNKLRKGNVREE